MRISDNTLARGSQKFAQLTSSLAFGAAFEPGGRVSPVRSCRIVSNTISEHPASSRSSAKIVHRELCLRIEYPRFEHFFVATPTDCLPIEAAILHLGGVLLEPF